MDSAAMEVVFQRLRDDLLRSVHLLGRVQGAGDPRFLEALGVIEGCAEFCDSMIPRPLIELLSEAEL